MNLSKVDCSNVYTICYSNVINMDNLYSNVLVNIMYRGRVEKSEDPPKGVLLLLMTLYHFLDQIRKFAI